MQLQCNRFSEPLRRVSTVQGVSNLKYSKSHLGRREDAGTSLVAPDPFRLCIGLFTEYSSYLFFLFVLQSFIVKKNKKNATMLEIVLAL